MQRSAKGQFGFSSNGSSIVEHPDSDEVRGLLSLLAAVKNPSLMSAAQVALDQFHYLFRDKIKVRRALSSLCLLFFRVRSLFAAAALPRLW